MADELRTLANGAVYDMTTKRIVSNPGGGTKAISQANASAMAKKRWQKYRQSAAKGILKEAIAIDPSVKTPADAWQLVTGKQYVALMDSDKPRADDLYRIGQIVGALPLAGELAAGQAQAQAGVTVTMSADTARDMIASLLNGCDNYTYHKQDIVDADASDVVAEEDNMVDDDSKGGE
jgi:hypothetical protein